MGQFAARQFVAPPSGNDGADYEVRKAGLPRTPAPYRSFEGRAEFSCRQHFFTGDVQADEAGHLSFVKVATYGVAYLGMQAGQIVGLGHHQCVP
ncbi:MAG: hypothetical protein WA135_05425 [Thiobacillus sp.]